MIHFGYELYIGVLLVTLGAGSLKISSVFVLYLHMYVNRGDIPYIGKEQIREKK